MPLPLDLYVEVTHPAAGAKYRWDANRPPQDRLLDFSFRTKLGEGFSDGSGRLARRFDMDYPDLGLVYSADVFGADGSIAYEGRVSALPRELSDTQSIGVTLTGWMAHAKDRKFTEIYVDRDINAWGPTSLGRRTALLAANYTVVDPEQTVDPTNGVASLVTHVDGAWASPYIPICEAWYDAGPGNTISAVAFSWKREGTTIGTTAPWNWSVTGWTTDLALVTSSTSGNLAAAGPGSGTVAMSTRTQFAVIDTYYNSSPAGTDGGRYAIDWSKVAVYGNNALQTYTGEPNEPQGVYASDVIKDIAGRWCPLLNTTGVESTNYVIQHLAFKDRTFPYDAFLEVNKFHLWHLGVWENRTLTFRPYSFADYDWEVRTDEGADIQLAGDSIEDVYSGVAVTYKDILTGKTNVLTPDTNPADLTDTSIGNPWNASGSEHWYEFELSAPTTTTQALQMGRAALASANRPKKPGTITVQGYVRDRAGYKQPGWKVRAGDTIAITNHPNDEPRLIHETSWDDNSKELTISVEAPASSMDALFDRLGVALTAKGLSS